MIKKNICKKNHLDKNINDDNLNISKDNNFKKLNDKIYKYKKKICHQNKLISKLEFDILNLNKNIKDLDLRAKANIDNMYKRNQLDIENMYKYSLEKFSKNILPIIDNLQNALKVSKNKNLDRKITYEGIKLTLKNFLSIIKKFGIFVINKINVNFDPNLHQAVSVIESKDIIKDNLVIEILQDGYSLNNRLLRPAMVKVIKFSKK